MIEKEDREYPTAFSSSALEYNLRQDVSIVFCFGQNMEFEQHMHTSI
jgi:hypothetical protein